MLRLLTKGVPAREGTYIKKEIKFREFGYRQEGQGAGAAAARCRASRRARL